MSPLKLLNDFNTRGYNMSKFPKKDLDYAKQNGSKVIDQIIYFIKKYNGISMTVAKWKNLFGGSMPKGLEGIEEQDAQAKHSLFLYFYALVFSALVFPSTYFITFITAFLSYLLSLQINVFKNFSFASDKEQRQTARDLDAHYTLYIKGFRDLLSQAVRKDDAEMESKCRAMIEALEKAQNTFRVKNRWLEGNKNDYFRDINI